MWYNITMKEKEYKKLAKQLAEMERQEDEEGMTALFQHCLSKPDFDIDKLDMMVQEILNKTK